MAPTQRKDETSSATRSSRIAASQGDDVAHSDGPGEGDASGTKDVEQDDEERPETD